MLHLVTSYRRAEIPARHAETSPRGVEPSIRPEDPSRRGAEASHQFAEASPGPAASDEIQRAPAIAPRKRIVNGKSYPQFRREKNETLVKIGYSKSDRRKYEHRSPRELLDHLAIAVAELGSGDRLVTSESLLASNVPGLAGVPTYQTYLCIAFLVHHGLLVRMGRSGYAISRESQDDFVAATSAAFKALPRR